MSTLYIVATPIGHLEDVTFRALRVLREADWLLAEDTRRTRILLDHFEIAQRATSLHEHNEASRIPAILEALEEGKSVALVSDAGTPLVSDPGSRLVAAVSAAGYRVEAVPGASALLAAWTVSGIEAPQVLFLGFLPRKAGARREVLEAQRHRKEAFVLFESPRRVAKTLAEIDALLGARTACLARELTKKHEEVLRGTAGELAEALEANPPRGECTLVIGGAVDDGAAVWPDERLRGAIRDALATGASVRDLAKELAHVSGHPRREVYGLAIALRDEAPRAEGEEAES